jgi:hypothetical protein
MTTAHDALVTVVVDSQSLGVFDTRSGGESDSDITKKQTGSGPLVLSGRPNHGDVTVTRVNINARDHELSRALRKRVGRGIMSVSEQPLDEDGNAWGKPTIWSGKLKTVDGGEYDADSEDARDLTLTMIVVDVA